MSDYSERGGSVLARKSQTELTRAEKEALSLIFQGMRSREVADALFISKRAVDARLMSAYRKLGVNNRIKAYRKLTPALSF